jgi:hypothetical protein
VSTSQSEAPGDGVVTALALEVLVVLLWLVPPVATVMWLQYSLLKRFRHTPR